MGRILAWKCLHLKLVPGRQRLIDIDSNWWFQIFGFGSFSNALWQSLWLKINSALTLFAQNTIPDGFFFFQFSTWIKAHMMMGRVSARQSWNKPRVHTGWVMPKGSQVFSDFISHLTEKCWVLTSWQNQKLWFTLYNFHGQSHVLLTFAPLSQYFLIVLNWHRVDLQWLRCGAKWFSYTYIYIHTFYI